MALTGTNDSLPISRSAAVGIALCIACLALLLTPFPASAQTQDVPPVMRIRFASPAQLDRLAATVDVWEVNHAAGYVLAPLTLAEERSLAQAGFLLSVDEVRTAQMRAQAAPSMATGGFACYRTVEETYATLDALSITYPNLARWVDIGDSWEKEQSFGMAGYDLRALVISNQASSAPKAVFYLLAAVHARELTTAESATRFGEHLVRAYGHDPDVTWLLDHNEIHIVPLGNPDGRKRAEAGFLWRKNVNNGDGCYSQTSFGVDLNRNGSFRWAGCGTGNCSSSDPCGLTFRGRAPGSEPETQALEAYARSILADQRGSNDEDAAPLDATGLFISLHSYGELVLFPWGWTNAASPNLTQLQTLGRKFGYLNGHAVCQLSQPGCLYRADGTNDDFVYGELGVASYTFELGNYFFESCTAFEETIWPTNLSALLYAAKAARRPYQTPSGPDVTRLDAGPMPIAPDSELLVEVTLDGTRYASNGFGEEPVQAVSGGQYSFNAPAWLAEPTQFDLPALPPTTTVSTTVSIPTTGLAVGRHMLFVEGRNAAGNLGPPSALFVDITSGQRALAAQAPSVLPAAIDSTLLVSLTVTNTGEIADEYRVSVTDSPWPVKLSSIPLPLEPGEAGVVTAQVAVPLADESDGRQPVSFVVYSAVEPWVQQELTVMAEIGQYRLFFPVAGR